MGNMENIVMNCQVKIVADNRENRSKIPDILSEKGAAVEFRNLKTGDYIVNDSIIFERKSKEDFVLSIIQNRLFAQCSRMKKTKWLTILLIEGNPYRTNHDISRQAVKGALISVAVTWQIPILYSGDASDSADIILLAGKQQLSTKQYLSRGNKPARISSSVLFFLQGLPSVGPVTAKALILKFGTLQNIILATEDELREVEGLGKNKAKQIRIFLGTEFRGKDNLY